MPTKTNNYSLVRICLGTLGRIVGIALVAAVLLLLGWFPYDIERPMSAQEVTKERDYYAKAFTEKGQDLSVGTSSEEEERYVRVGENAAQSFHVQADLGQFVSKYGLAGKKALDVGSGRGYLQDIVSDYTGLDISSTAQRFYHKKFVLGSATAMPFQNDSFDIVWSIWVLEHVPNPEQALREIRRVAKDGAILYLAPAWDCQPYLAGGYNVRPYSDFGVKGKLIKASIPAIVTGQVLGRMASYPLRYSSWQLSGQPTTFHFRRLQPNYETYWGPDADAINSLDRYETQLWFQSRGDECLNCASGLDALTQEDGRLIIRVRKSAAGL